MSNSGELVRAITSADLSSSRRARDDEFDDDDDSDSDDASVHENIVTRTPGARAAHLSLDSSESPALSEQDFYDGLLLSTRIVLCMACLRVCVCVFRF